MKNTKLVYMGRDGIATNYYSLTEGQKAKRGLLGIKNNYDILDMTYLERICKDSDTIMIYGLDVALSDNNYLFNHLIEIGVPMGKVISPDGIINTPTIGDNTGSWHGEYFNDYTLTKDMLRSSRLVSMALDSVHNLYYKTDRWNTCMKYTSEYSRTTTNKSAGFKVNTNADYELSDICNTAFSHTVKESYSEFWKLDNDRYYMVSIKGLGYQLRLMDRLDLKDVLKVGGVRKLSDIVNSDELFNVIWPMRKRISKSIKDGISASGITNRMLYGLIGRVYKMSKDINLFYCDNTEITFAVERYVDVLDILKVINNYIIEDNIEHCFDFIDITKPSKEIEIYENNVDSRIPIRALKNIGVVEHSTEDTRNTDIVKQLNSLYSKEERRGVFGIFSS